jgi:hypothetical protein
MDDDDRTGWDAVQGTEQQTTHATSKVKAHEPMGPKSSHQPAEQPTPQSEVESSDKPKVIAKNKPDIVQRGWQSLESYRE